MDRKQVVAQCRLRRAELKTAVPAERQRCAAQIATLRAGLALAVSKAKSDSRARVASMREGARVRACVTAAAGAPRKRSAVASLARGRVAFEAWAARMVEPRRRAAAWGELPGYARLWWAETARAKPADARAAFAAYNRASGGGDAWADVAPHAREAYGLVAAALKRRKRGR